MIKGLKISDSGALAGQYTNSSLQNCNFVQKKEIQFYNEKPYHLKYALAVSKGN